MPAMCVHWLILIVATTLWIANTETARAQSPVQTDSTTIDSTRQQAADSSKGLTGMAVRALTNEWGQYNQSLFLVFCTRSTTHSDSTHRIVGVAGEFGLHVLLISSSTSTALPFPYGEFGLEARIGPFYALADVGAAIAIGPWIPAFYARPALGLSLGNRKNMVIQIEAGSYVPFANIKPTTYLGLNLMVH
jgi:hypothetical protein